MAGLTKIPGWVFSGAAILFAGLFLSFLLRSRSEAGWGINGRVSTLEPARLELRLALLREAKVKWLREDFQWKNSPNDRQVANFNSARGNGFRILSLIPYGIEQKPVQPENQLHEDLRDVFQAAREWSSRTRDNLDAWELYNEADVGFCRDLPDRSAAYAKAIYLGLRAGGGPVPKPVIMGALALPPGPWLQRAKDNGLLEYADAYNFHYYGNPGDFGAVWKIHGDFAGQLPLWITECGFSADESPGGRDRQGEYFEEILPAVQKAGPVSFMPYAVRDNAGFSMVGKDGVPFPAWEVFSNWARNHEEQAGAIFSRQKSPVTVVCQWLPGSGQAVPHKVSGTYRFRTDPGSGRSLPMAGEVRLYNFGTETARGSFGMKGLHFFWAHADLLRRIEVPPGGMVAVPVIFTSPSPGYHREWCNVRFQGDEKSQVSKIGFGLETPPVPEYFNSTRLAFLDWPEGDGNKFSFAYIAAPAEFSGALKSGPWIGLNGLTVKSGDDGSKLTLRMPAENPGGGPPMAVARVNGLPAGEFLRLESDSVFDQNFYVRVDLIDLRGQRFTIFENAGMSYFERKKEAWLSLQDFHLYFWGRGVNSQFKPADVREIQLRPFVKDPAQERTLSLEIRQSREAGL